MRILRDVMYKKTYIQSAAVYSSGEEAVFVEKKFLKEEGVVGGGFWRRGSFWGKKEKMRVCAFFFINCKA